jgi:hypothetical protein
MPNSTTVASGSAPSSLAPRSVGPFVWSVGHRRLAGWADTRPVDSSRAHRPEVCDD